MLALELENNNKISVACGDGSTGNVYYADIPTPNEWHHLVAISDWISKRLKLYVDGVKVIDGEITISNHASSDSIKIGGSGYNNIGEIKGLIGQVRIYNRALTDEEIKILYKEAKFKFID